VRSLGREKILDVDVSNVTEAIANLTSRGAPEPVIKLILQLNENGLVSISDAFAFGEVKDDSLTGVFDASAQCAIT
jgi:hypoxia up-regulated 1